MNEHGDLSIKHGRKDKKRRDNDSLALSQYPLLIPAPHDNKLFVNPERENIYILCIHSQLA